MASDPRPEVSLGRRSPMATTRIVVADRNVITRVGIRSILERNAGMAVVAEATTYDAVIDASPKGAVELFHGYTYSGIPVAVAAALAVQEIFEKDDIFNRAKNLAPYFQKGLFSLQDLESVDNIRGYGMMGGIDMKLNTKPGKAGYECFKACYEAGVNFKATGDCLIIAPQFICEEKHIDEIIEKLRTGITNYQKNQKN